MRERFDDGAHPVCRRPHVLWSTCDFSDRWWTTPFSDGRCLPRCTRVGRASLPCATPTRTYFGLPSSMAAAAMSSVRSAEKNSSPSSRGCSARSSARSPVPLAPPTSWSAWRPRRRNFRYTWSRCVVPAVGITSFSPTSWVPYRPRSNRAGRGRVHANRTVEQRVSDTIASLSDPVGTSTCLPQTLETCT